MTFEALTEAIVAFRDERDWEQFHTLKNLAAALSVEAAELQELFLWSKDDSSGVSPADDRLSEEIADILIYALLVCHEAEIDPEKAIKDKLERNRQRYPVEDARGRSAKYTELGDAE